MRRSFAIPIGGRVADGSMTKPAMSIPRTQRTVRDINKMCDILGDGMAVAQEALR